MRVHRATQNRVKSFDRHRRQESGKKVYGVGIGLQWWSGEGEGASKYRFLLVSRRRRDVTAAWRGYGCGTYQSWV